MAISRTDIDALVAELERRIGEVHLERDRGEEVTAALGELTKAVSGPLLTAVLNVFEGRAPEFRRRKIEILLAMYLRLAEETQQAVHRLFGFVDDPHGHALFTKILQMLDDEPPDPEYMHLLARILQKCTDSDFVGLFREHKYAVSMLAQLSVQQLRLLADLAGWPDVFPPERGIGLTSGEVIGPWADLWVKHYSPCHSMDDLGRARVAHAMHDLRGRGLVIGVQGNVGKPMLIRVRPTAVGAELARYVGPR